MPTEEKLANIIKIYLNEMIQKQELCHELPENLPVKDLNKKGNRDTAEHKGTERHYII